jgi:methyl-accepting chemotaxis protein
LEGIEQVNQAIVQMDDSTQQNAALVEEAAAAAAAMREQALQLSEAVGIFRLDPAQQQASVIPLSRASRHAAPARELLMDRPRRITASGNRSARAEDWKSL